VGTPRSKLKEFEQALLEGDWKQVQDEVEVKLVNLPDTTETYVLCRSRSRREKEKAIRHRFSQRLEQGLGRLHQRIAQGRLKDPTKIQQALARLRVQHSRVADLYQTSLVEREGTVQLEWQRREERLAWREVREGAYLLRTNLSGETAEELWKKYIQLTEAEAAFRVLKSALWIRPLFHQLERRIKAHILVAFLGYALWVTLKHLLQRKACGLSPTQALARLAILHSADIVLPTTDGREIRLRRVSTPDPQQQQLLDQLGLTVPQGLELNFECSVDSALA
jgi:transposase